MLGWPFMINFISTEWLSNGSFSLIPTTWRAFQRKIVSYIQCPDKWGGNPPLLKTGSKRCYWWKHYPHMLSKWERRQSPPGTKVCSIYLMHTLANSRSWSHKYYNGSFGKNASEGLSGWIFKSYRPESTTWPQEKIHYKDFQWEPPIVGTGTESERSFLRAALPWWFGL